MNLIEIPQMSEEFKMTGKNIMVKLEDLEMNKETKTESGIIIARASEKSAITDRNTYGKVVSVGKDVKEIKVNDHVFWHIVSGVEVKFRDGFFMIMEEDRIMGVSL